MLPRTETGTEQGDGVSESIDDREQSSPPEADVDPAPSSHDPGSPDSPDGDEPFAGLTTAELIVLVYDELRALARSRQKSDRIAAEMNPSSLLHRTYVRLAGRSDARWYSRAHFVTAAAEAMRRVCIDEARRIQTRKRGGDRMRVPLSDVMDRNHAGLISERIGMLELNEAIDRLARHNSRAAEIVKMRFFTGMTIQQVAAVLGTDTRTIDRDWMAARAWLFAELSDES